MDIEKNRKNKPTTRFDLHKDSHVPKPGDSIHARVKGKVVRVETGKDRYGEKPKANRVTVEIEHEPDSAMMEPAGKGRSIADIEDENARV